MSASPAEAAPLRLLVFGAGAIGTYLGGSLARQGAQVVFLERPETRRVIKKTGLRLNLPDGEFLISSPTLADSLSQALDHGPFDAALFALKSFDTRSALVQIAPFASRMPPMVCFQNGVENEGMIAEVLGEGSVIAGTVTSAIGRAAPGDITLERLRGVGLALGHPMAVRLAAACNRAGLNARLYSSASAMKWSKLVTNLIANASSAILGLTPAQVLAHPGLFRLEIVQMREALNVMRALHIPVCNLPGAPVRMLAFAVQRLPGWLARFLLLPVLSRGRGAKMPSFYLDLHGGRGQSEVAYLNGAVARFGEQAGVPTPLNHLLTDTLLALTDGQIALEAFYNQPEKLLNLWQSG